jgi:hypothetical protein
MATGTMAMQHDVASGQWLVARGGQQIAILHFMATANEHHAARAVGGQWLVARGDQQAAVNYVW